LCPTFWNNSGIFFIRCMLIYSCLSKYHAIQRLSPLSETWLHLHLIYA
jgi:hypothetical protein